MIFESQKPSHSTFMKKFNSLKKNLNGNDYTEMFELK